MQRERSESALGALLIGAALGAAVSYLLAPRAGVETRRQWGGWLHEHRPSHDFWVKLKKLLTTRSNGITVDGRTTRRHRRAS